VLLVVNLLHKDKRGFFIWLESLCITDCIDSGPLSTLASVIKLRKGGDEVLL
jgi:hypothetical protein